MSLSDAACQALAAHTVKHARDPCTAYGELVLLVGRILDAALEDADGRHNEDAAIVFGQLLREHRAAWSQMVLAQMLSRN